MISDYSKIHGNYLNKLLTASTFKNILLKLPTPISGEIVTLLEEFAREQDKLYGGTYVNDKSTLLDDFIEIAYLYKYHDTISLLSLDEKQIENAAKESVYNKLLSVKDKIMSDVHDAWAYARLLKFKVSGGNIVGIEPFTEQAGKDDDFNKLLVTLQIPQIGDVKLQLRRIAQLVDFQNLKEFDHVEAIKDTVPIITYKHVINAENFAIAKQIHDIVFGEQALGQVYAGKTFVSEDGKIFTSTNRRVKLAGRSRVVYVGKRGGEYIKQEGKYISLTKACKASI